MKQEKELSESDPRAAGERERLIEKHARFAVLEGQNHGDSYRPTPREANLLHNMRLILRSFAAELHQAEAAAAHRSAPVCDCGGPVTQCYSCAVGDWQAAHPECKTCCPVQGADPRSAPPDQNFTYVNAGSPDKQFPPYAALLMYDPRPDQPTDADLMPRGADPRSVAPVEHCPTCINHPPMWLAWTCSYCGRSRALSPAGVERKE